MKRQYSNLSEKTLLIVAENFGLNFSGGSRATAMIALYFEKTFNKIKVLCLKEGKHNLNNIQVISYRKLSELPQLVKTHSNKETIGFGDFHIASPLAKSGMPYFFVYHDNYPEIESFSPLNKKVHKEIMETYGKIFSTAAHVFSVTDYKLSFIQKYTKKVSVVRNGLSQKVTKRKQRPLKKGSLRILMAGNIDQRKYEKAVDVFNQIEQKDSSGIQIDIFGNVLDESLKNKLNAFDFVQYKGFADQLRYDDYDLYLNTSLVENLSLSVVDALANRTPVVSFLVGGIKEVVDDKNGRIIEAFDTEAMALTLISIKNKEINFQLSDLNLEEFDWEKSAAKMLLTMNNNL